MATVVQFYSPEIVMGAICRCVPNADRKRLWESVNGPVPEGKRLGESCAVRYCGQLAHMVLAEDGNAGRASWKVYVEAVKHLEMDQFVDFPAYSNTKADQNKLANAFKMNKETMHKRFSLRSLSLSRGGVRVTCTGSHFGYYNNSPELKTTAYQPMLVGHVVKPWQRPPIWVLQSPSLHISDMPDRTAFCNWKGCQFPKRIAGNCRYHFNFFKWRMSMTDRAIDFDVVYSPKEPDKDWQLVIGHQPISTANLEKSLRFTTDKAIQRNPTFDIRHRNAGDAMLETAAEEDQTIKKVAIKRGAYTKKARVRQSLELQATKILNEEFDDETKQLAEQMRSRQDAEPEEREYLDDVSRREATKALRKEQEEFEQLFS